MNGTQKREYEFNMGDALNTLVHCNKTLTQWKSDDIKTVDDQFEKAFMLRHLIHIIGDVHMPLHASTMYNDGMFVNGDMGGNLFNITFKSKNRIDNLHMLFDSVLERVRNNLSRVNLILFQPLSENDTKYFIDLAGEYMKEFPRENLPEMSMKKYSDWTDESYKACVDVVYSGIEFGGTPTTAYIDKAYAVLKKRLTLGGYRLANAVIEIYDAYKLAKDKTEEKFLTLLE
jgi:hypothetical protein